MNVPKQMFPQTSSKEEKSKLSDSSFLDVNVLWYFWNVGKRRHLKTSSQTNKQQII